MLELLLKGALVRHILHLFPISFTSVFYLESWTKGWRQIQKFKQNRFFYGMFYSCFFENFYQKTSKIGFWVDG